MNRATLAVILGLVAVGGAATAAPRPAFAQQEVRVKIRLTGPAIAGVLSEGNSEYRERGTRRSLKVEAGRVNLPDGTILTVVHNGAVIGTLTLALRRGVLDLDTNRGNAVPAVRAGDTITVLAPSGATVLSGRF